MPKLALLHLAAAVAGLLRHDFQAAAWKVRSFNAESSPGDIQRNATALLHDMSGPLVHQLEDIDEATYDYGDGRLAIITSTNSKYSMLTRNLYASMKRVGRDKLIVFCEDAACKPALEGKGMHVIETGNGFAEAGAYDSPSFNFITGRKPAYVYWCLRRGDTVLWTDSDVSWMIDPVPSLTSMSQSFIAQDDSKLRGEGGVPPSAAVGARKANTGFMWVRPTELGMTLAASWLLQMGSLRDPKLQDQRVFQAAFRSQCRRICSEELGPCEPSSDCTLLSRERCPNGSVPKWRWSKQALAYHANWHNGISAKVEQMKQKGLWLLEPQSAKTPGVTMV